MDRLHRHTSAKKQAEEPKMPVSESQDGPPELCFVTPAVGKREHRCPRT